MRRILVTGANRGIGLEFARQLLARGDRVYAACRHPGRALALTELAAAHPGHLAILPLDLASERSIHELARELAGLTEALDALINNAGVLIGGERFGALGAKALIDSFATNAAGPLLLAQALAPLLAKGERATVLNVTSELGSLARATRFGTPSYAISKAALNMATRQMAHALAPLGISALCVHPGWVRTDMGGATAPLAPRESVAGLIRVLDAVTAADAGRFLDHTGAELPW
jgi:NAD(P)-dependent dehydrogenase (short-subunit alcohol dehydrogenase family)